MSGYSYKEEETGIGMSFIFEGPGLGRYASSVHVMCQHEGDTIARMLARAYEAGRRARAKEIREALGIHDASPGAGGASVESLYQDRWG